MKTHSKDKIVKIRNPYVEEMILFTKSSCHPSKKSGGKKERKETKQKLKDWEKWE